MPFISSNSRSLTQDEYSRACEVTSRGVWPLLSSTTTRFPSPSMHSRSIAPPKLVRTCLPMTRRLGSSTDMSSASQSSIHCSRLAFRAGISDSFLSAVISHNRTCCIASPCDYLATFRMVGAGIVPGVGP